MGCGAGVQAEEEEAAGTADAVPLLPSCLIMITIGQCTHGCSQMLSCCILMLLRDAVQAEKQAIELPGNSLRLSCLDFSRLSQGLVVLSRL